tara:strand:- start:83 stop:505 length:423 start_codon:yes stop_codon:yes gene_type:complete
MYKFWDIQNKFIKKKTNKFISTKTFRKSFKSKVDFDKNYDKTKTFRKSFKSKVDFDFKSKVDFEKNHDFSKIDALMKKSKQFLSFKNNSSFNNEQSLDELLNESLLLIICTELINTSNRYNKKLYQKIFGDKWRDIQSLL